MSPKHLKSCIEGLLFAAGDEGLEVRQLAAVLEQEEADVAQLLEQMKKEFAKAGRGIQIVEMGGSYQLTTLPEHAPYFQRLAASPTRGTLSQASLETLAIVAYRQPITRMEIEEIRGVKSERAIHTLASKDLIEAKGRSEAVGRPILYATTKRFMDYFGLRSMDDLPASSQFDHSEGLAEETRLLFEKLDQQALGEVAQ